MTIGASPLGLGPLGGAVGGSGATSGASVAAVDSITTAGAVGKAVGAAVAATVAITAAGVVGTNSDASISETATITAAGSIMAANEGQATISESAAVTAAGAVGKAGGASVAESAELAADGSIGTGAAAGLSAAADVQAAGASGFGGGASSTYTFTITAAGEVNESGHAGASVPGIVTITATGAVQRYDTDVSNRAEGIELEVEADAEWEPAIEPVPDDLPMGQDDLVVLVVDGYDRSGGFAVPIVREVRRPRERIRIRVGGADWSYRDGIPTVVPDVQFQIPLLHGPGTWQVPQFDPASDDAFGVGAFKRIVEQKPVQLDLIDEWPESETYGQVVRKGFWRGFIQALEADDNSENGADIELAGQAHGRAVMEWHPEPLVRRVRDAGRYLWNSLVGKLGQRMQPRIPHIGINLANRGGTYEDQYLLDQLQLMVDRDTGAQWTVMPDEDGIYHAQVKDYETVHWTIYRDGALNKRVKNTDLAERLNVVYADAVAPDGHRINFAIAPRMLRGSIPPYPFEDGRTFGIGTTDEGTDTGSGVTALIWRLMHLGKLHVEDLPGGYDEDVAQAVIEVKEQGRMLPATGNVTEDFWNTILWDNLPNGYSDEWAHIRPAVQRSKTEKFLRSGSGAIIGRNPDYDPKEIVRAAAFSMGQAPSTRQVVRAARGELAPVNERDWVVQYTLDGGVIEGEHNPGEDIDPSMIRNPILVQPGQNVWDPYLDGGRLVQIGNAQLQNDGKRVVLTGSTRGYDGPKLWEIWDRSRETREALARGRSKPRASTIRQDNVAPWDRWSGQTDREWQLTGNLWTPVVVPSAGAGTLNDISIILGKPARFAVAISTIPLPITRWNRKVHPLEQPPTDPQHHLITVTGDPKGGTFTLSDGGGESSALSPTATAAAVQAAVRGLGGAFASATVRGPAGGPWRVTMAGTSEGNLNVGSNDLTKPSDASVSITSAGPTTGDGTPWYGQDDIARMMKTYDVIYTAGQWDQACGFGNYVENDGHLGADGQPEATSEPPSGEHFDIAGVEYEAPKNALFTYLWVEGEDNTLPRQQLYHQQLASA